MDKYEIELQKLKPWDEIQTGGKTVEGYKFITTAGHGYLVVPSEDKHYQKAKENCDYSFIGEHAIYLEEDCAKWQFLDSIR